MYNLKVDGMTCSHCVAAVTQAIKSVDAVAAPQVDLATGLAEIDSGVPVGRFVDAIAAEGYTATPLAA
jgi:copper chaperone